MPGNFCSSVTSAVLILIFKPVPDTGSVLLPAFTVSALTDPEDGGDPDDRGDPGSALPAPPEVAISEGSGFTDPAVRVNVCPAALVPGWFVEGDVADADADDDEDADDVVVEPEVEDEDEFESKVEDVVVLRCDGGVGADPLPVASAIKRFGAVCSFGSAFCTASIAG